MSKSAFCIFIDTVCAGRIPAWHDEKRLPVVYPTLEAAQREIAGDVMERLRRLGVGDYTSASRFDPAWGGSISGETFEFSRSSPTMCGDEAKIERTDAGGVGGAED